MWYDGLVEVCLFVCLFIYFHLDNNNTNKYNNK